MRTYTKAYLDHSPKYEWLKKTIWLKYEPAVSKRVKDLVNRSNYNVNFPERPFKIDLKST